MWCRKHYSRYELAWQCLHTAKSNWLHDIILLNTCSPSPPKLTLKHQLIRQQKAREQQWKGWTKGTWVETVQHPKSATFKQTKKFTCEQLAQTKSEYQNSYFLVFATQAWVHLLNIEPNIKHKAKLALNLEKNTSCWLNLMILFLFASVKPQPWMLS